MKRFVAYLRFSTDRQGRSGLGLEGQQAVIQDYVASVSGYIVAEFTETESGRKVDHPKLAEAQAQCRRDGATLLIAKLDRLARNVHLITRMLESDVPFVVADMPWATPFELHIRAAVAEEEARTISARTKAALAAAKARGKSLGGERQNACDLRPYAVLGGKNSGAARAKKAELRAADLAFTIHELRVSGANTLAALARELNMRQIGTARGKQWSPVQVSRVLARIG
ncbi:recombinase family protein [Belnapia moabensis]|uniref:recombinase family protein n=1 Tax=Belnapia moabensis TaxID=365533 RepID=UPI0005BD88D5|nr:recombinase family protein [Belnapia moabensis]